MIRKKRLIGYIRVSTIMQGESGAGLQAQENMIREFCNRHKFVLLDIFKEVHSGGDNQRKILHDCIKSCQDQGADLIVAKIDRLARRVSMVSGFEENYGIRFYVANLGIDANKTMVHLLSIFAEMERETISGRVKRGIERKKIEGTYRKPTGNKEVWKLGGVEKRNQNAEKYREQVFRELQFIYSKYTSEQSEGVKMPLSEMVEKLNERGNYTFTGKEWTGSNLKYFLNTYKETVKEKKIYVKVSA